MYRLDARSTMVGLRLHRTLSAILDSRKHATQGGPHIRPNYLPQFCGQSRTTIRARHYASLIGRLCVGGN
ncbi:MAG: hypothetical protein ABW104_06920 [Candidatus Thiodiazotropha sp. 6PLUC2]